MSLSVDGMVAKGGEVQGAVVVRPGARIEKGHNPWTCHSCQASRIGRVCEIKNSIIVHGTKIPNLSYVGDSIIGAGV